MVRCLRIRRFDVGCGLLDAARLETSRLGASRRVSGGTPNWHFKLLDEQLLGRSTCSDWRRPCFGRHATSDAPADTSGWNSNGNWVGIAGEFAALRRVTARYR